MEEPEKKMIEKTKCKNIVIIGNGFDLYHKLPTKFSDFYNYYSNQESNTLYSQSVFSGVTNTISNTLYNKHNIARVGTPFSHEQDWNNIEEFLCCSTDLGYDEILRNFNSCFVPYVKKICMPDIGYFKHIDTSLSELFSKVDTIITFNYTDTLKMYLSDELYKKKVYHIHGNLAVNNSIVIGNGLTENLEKSICHTKTCTMRKDFMRKTFEFQQRTAQKNYDDLVADVDNYSSLTIHVIGHSLGKTDAYELTKYIKQNKVSSYSLKIILYSHDINNIAVLKSNIEKNLGLSYNEVDIITSHEILRHSNDMYFPFYKNTKEFLLIFTNDEKYQGKDIYHLYEVFMNKYRPGNCNNLIDLENRKMEFSRFLQSNVQ